MKKLAALLLVLMVGQLFASVITTTYTPTYLYNNANFPVGTRTLGSGGAYLDITSNSSINYNRVLEMGVYSGGSQVKRVTFIADIVAATSDNDIAICLTDGGSVVGFMRLDINNTSGTGLVLEAPRDMSSYNALITTTNVGFSQVFTVEMILNANSTTITGTVNGNVISATSTARAINPNTSLAMILRGDDANEIYRINSLQVQVEIVPEPGTMVLLVLSCLMFGLIRRNAK